MIIIIKKYLIQKWWIPLLSFVLAIILLYTDFIFPNSGFSTYLIYFTGFILLISCVLQFFKGSKLIAFLQFSVLIIPIIIFGYMIYILNVMFNKPDSSLSEGRIQPLIEEKTNFIIPKEYKVLKNLIHHTEGAFDSDYSIELTIEYKESDEKNITEQILKSMKLEMDKGSWKNYDDGFDFEHNNNEINRAEPFYFKVDTLNNKLELNLSHL